MATKKTVAKSPKKAAPKPVKKAVKAPAPKAVAKAAPKKVAKKAPAKVAPKKAIAEKVVKVAKVVKDVVAKKVAKKAPTKVAKVEKAVVSKAKAQEVLFQVFSPESGSVAVAGEFNSWNPEKGKMKKSKAGLWTLKMKLTPGSYQYKVVYDGSWEVLADEPQVMADHGPNNVKNV